MVTTATIIVVVYVACYVHTFFYLFTLQREHGDVSLGDIIGMLFISLFGPIHTVVTIFEFIISWKILNWTVVRQKKKGSPVG